GSTRSRSFRSSPLQSGRPTARATSSGTQLRTTTTCSPTSPTPTTRSPGRGSGRATESPLQNQVNVVWPRAPNRDTLGGMDIRGGAAAPRLTGAPPAPGPVAAAVSPPPAEYARTVTHICRGALLFEGSHEIGTRAGAVAVSHDIRATGSRRLARVDAVPKPAATARVAVRWIAIERRLVATYATAYLQVWGAIEKATTPRQHAR